MPGAVEALLPTPPAGNFNDGEDLESWEARRQRNLAKGYNGNGQGTPLGVAVSQLLPSPRATDGTKGSPNQRGSSGDLMLPSAVHELLRTPTSNLGSNGGSQHPGKRRAGGHQPTLADEVEHLLPTPTARLGDDTSRGADPARYKGPQSLNGRRSNLDDCVAAVEAKSPWLLPTPMAADGWENPPRQPGSNTTRWGGVNSLGGLAEQDFRPAGMMLPTPRAVRGASGTETMYALGGERSDADRPQGEVLLPTPQVADVTGGHRSRSGSRSDEPLLPAVAEQMDDSWGPYAAAIFRWARATGMEPPSPVEPGRNGKSRLSPRFVEWMQGLPAGWVTAVPGLSRNAQLKILGNGVVPQQGLLALRRLALRVPLEVRVSRS